MDKIYSASSLVVPLFGFSQLQNIFACKFVIVTAIFMKSGVDNATSSFYLCAKWRWNTKGSYRCSATNVTTFDATFVAPGF